ncbi:phage tail protein [Sulfitobacter sp. KE29]|uniref:TipJ family phage tail tip protein n=1 Tax=unclassified Sulfitobacter TaxID=196795 RepID=UPI0023E2B5CB|nr:MULTISPECIES: phage tail protein [unclassified Sulfitobacter]MDF3420144.1 phage tail protein [Sulfitobacter sp. Ks38]MDF3427629.1 phage tail protein [Sulfitobacter sp. KE29]MDF3431208.1 phage tail protein [Sulfitobacter sp. S46]MDF3445981.1 phage tail protein [Sulfitobacter sp. KE31]MDF3549990.1 phage tail protein [Sulfitobacter sp. KE28]
MTGSNLTVLSAPLLDPGMGRARLEMPQGLTVAAIVAAALPGHATDLAHLRVVLVGPTGTSAIEPQYWTQVRPKAGTQIVIRSIPGKDALRSVLLAVVSVAALAFAPAVAGFIGVTSKVGIALVGAGLSVAGQLLVNALIPPSMPDSGEKRNVYRIEGWRNEMRPGAPVPFALGRHRYAPPFAATSWTEVVGDFHYVRALFCFGYGPLRISDIRIGETPITDFEDVDIELREGRPDDEPLSLFPEQVLEETAGAELVRPFPRDATGEVIDGAESVETPVTRFTASNAARASVILGFQGGLFRIDSKGRLKGRNVLVRIRARLNGVGPWSDVATLDIYGKKRESFLRQHSWELPSRGRWQIEVTRLTDDNDSTQVSDKVVLAAVQSVRPEYPINLDKPLALAAVRVRATYQLNGPLNAFNALIEREGQVHDDGAWTMGYGRTPATAYLAALTGSQNPFPAAETEIDMDQIADWHDWCIAKGLKYDRVHDVEESLGEMLMTICAAGRATPRHDGLRWGVVIDRPETLVIDHINPRNSAQFEWSRSYFNPPDGMRIRFLDETNNYEEAERVVPWPGHTGEVELTESLELPGKTDPAEIYIEARRRMYELIHRPDSLSAIQSGAARVATRGDLVMGSFDVLAQTQLAARVTSVSGKLVELDEEALIPEGYGMRFRIYADADDVIGSSTLRGLTVTAEPTRALVLKGTGEMPSVGEVVHIGPMATESLPLRVRGVEAAEDFHARLLMVAAAPEIDTLVDAEEAPAWDGRVGEEVDLTAVVPAAPVFLSILTGQVGTDTENGLQLILGPGAGSTATVTDYEIDHRLAGETVWSTVTISAAAGGASIEVYAAGAPVELRARAFANTTPSDHTVIANVIIGGDDPAIPAALSDEAITVTGSLGHARINIAVPTAEAPSQIQIYRVPAGNPLDRDTHAVGLPIGVSSGSTISYVDGDGTRSNLIDGGEFGSGDAWVLGGGWSIAAGKATHAPGIAGALAQPLSLSAGKTYRTGFTVLDYSAGTVTPRLTGGTDVSGTAVTSAGLVLDRLSAVSGNTEFAINATSAFDGAIDNLIVFLETTSCIDAGTWDYWVEPQNDGNIAGPISGPFAAAIY